MSRLSHSYNLVYYPDNSNDKIFPIFSGAVEAPLNQTSAGKVMLVQQIANHAAVPAQCSKTPTFFAQPEASEYKHHEARRPGRS